MKIIGREKEQEKLWKLRNSNKPEFLVVYGRRRVGKTFLIRECFNNNFSFYTTGISDKKMKDQLMSFNESLIEAGYYNKKIPEDWFDAFKRLRELIESGKIKRDSANNKIVLFIDELPWLDTPKSNFKSALDYFWNKFASSREDLLLIVCGSATSWIIKNILSSSGGFYNRVTAKINLLPFSLKECELFLHDNGLVLPKNKIIETYMIFGGIPFYLSMLEKNYSLPQNVEYLIFNENGSLHYEFDMLFKSLFKKYNIHKEIIIQMAKRKNGVLRTELSACKNIGDGEPLTTALRELEECGFIRKYNNFNNKKNNCIYQLIDSFTLFYVRFLLNKEFNSWVNYFDTPSYYSWLGNSFEIVCLNHINQIKNVLGISGIESNDYSWTNNKKDGAQIDLIIDRKDDVINICEMKFSKEEYSIDSKYERELINKLNVFKEETKTKKTLHLTFISASGLKMNEYSDIVINKIDGDKLFIF